MGVRTIAKEQEGNKNIKKQRGNETEALKGRQGKKVYCKDRNINKKQVMQGLRVNEWSQKRWFYRLSLCSAIQVLELISAGT